MTQEPLAAHLQGASLRVRGPHGRPILMAQAEALLGDGRLVVSGAGLVGWRVEPRDTGDPDAGRVPQRRRWSREGRAASSKRGQAPRRARADAGGADRLAIEEPGAAAGAVRSQPGQPAAAPAWTVVAAPTGGRPGRALGGHANDPDCVLARAHQTDLTADEVHAWASVVALGGGMVVVGDDVAAPEPARVGLLAGPLPSLGQAADLVAGRPDRLRLRIRRGWASWQIVALANWTDAPARDLVFDPPEWAQAGAFHLVDLWRGEYSGPHTGAVVLGALPPHGVKLLSVHAADPDRAHVVGSTGHLLGEAVDVRDERWDGRTLHVTLGGRHDGELIAAGPANRLQRIRFWSGQDSVRVEVGACG